jgi:hypothetical protein
MTPCTPFEVYMSKRFAVSHETAPYRVRANRRWLCRVFAEQGYRVGAEVGVWQGAFSQELCVANPGVRLTCVDPWRAYGEYHDLKNDQRRLDAAYRQTCETLQPYAVTILRMRSLDALEVIPDRSLDFVYIDSNHSEPFVTQDLTGWSAKVRSGGIVSGHDYVWRKKRPDIEVKQAVDRFTAHHGITSWFVFADDKSPSFAWMVP